MKTLIIFAILVWSLSSSLAQMEPMPIDSFIKSDSFIFEAKFVSAKCFFAPNGVTILTSRIYKISKVFKGKLNCGNVEIVSQGGTIGHKTQMVSDGPTISDSGVIFAVPGYWPAIQPPKENPFSLELSTMVEYYIGINGQNVCGYYASPVIPGTKALYDTLYKYLGHPYRDCEIYPQTREGTTVYNGSSESGIHEVITPINQDIEVVPNPVEKSFSFKVPVDADYFMVLYDTNGRTVYSGEKRSGKQLQNLIMPRIKPGTYTGMLVSGLNVYHFKFVKE